MISSRTIQNVTFDKDNMNLKIDGEIISVQLDKISPKLKVADDFQRQFFKISPSGYGIHWPLLDEDISIEVLIKTTSII
jgi:hypothetical protein